MLDRVNEWQHYNAVIKHHANIVGPQIRKLRHNRGWSQERFALQLQLRGLDIGRDVLARLECQLRFARDTEIFFLAHALDVTVCELFPILDGDLQSVCHAKKL